MTDDTTSEGSTEGRCCMDLCSQVELNADAYATHDASRPILETRRVQIKTKETYYLFNVHGILIVVTY